MSIKQTWRHVKFGYTTGFIWFTNFILYALLLLEKVEEAEFQVLSWFMLLTLGAFLISVRFVPHHVEEAGRPNWDEIFTFTIIGFVVNFLLFLAISLFVQMVFTFGVLGANTYEVLIGLSAAINEEIFRWSSLRVLGHQRLQLRFLPPTIQGLTSSALITGAIVNTLWCFYHAQSYVDAPAFAWATLWFAGAIITLCMYFSEHILTAILIHALWNLAVILEFSFLGVVLVIMVI